jgi:PTS system nitrogen regulatory IIA component
MSLESLADPALIFPALRCSDAADLLRQMARKIVDSGRVKDPGRLFEKLWEREQLGTTAIGAGVAIPHCKMAKLGQVVLAVGLLEEGIDFAAVDEQPVRVVFCIVSPDESPAAHLQCLAAISRWVKENRHIERLLELEDPQAIYALLREDGA